MKSDFASVILLMGTAIALAFAWIAWWRRRSVGAQTLAVLLLLGGLWTFGNALMLRSLTLESKLLWLNAEMVAINLVGPTWFIFAANYHPRNAWMSRWVRAAVFLPALFFILLVWTNPWHGWVFENTQLEMVEGHPYLAYEWGAGRWAILLFAYGTTLAGIVLFVRKFWRLLYMHRQIARYFTLSCVLVVAFDVLTMISPPLAPNFDASALVIVLIGAFLVMTSLRRNVWEIMPLSVREILRNMHDGVLVLDKHDRIISCNQATSELLGRSQTELYGVHPAEMVGWSSFELEEVPKQAQLLALQWTRISQYGEEQGTLDLEVRALPLYDGGHRLQGRLLLLRDQTQQLRAERKLWASEADLRAVQRTESIGHLAGDVARGVGELLDNVNDELTSVLEHLSYKHPAASRLRTSLHNTHHAMQMVNQLLAYAGHVETKVEYINISQIVAESRELFESIVRTGSKLEIELDTQAPLVLGDPAQIQQILFNLLMNASDAVQLNRQLNAIEESNPAQPIENRIKISVRPYLITSTPKQAPHREGTNEYKLNGVDLNGVDLNGVDLNQLDLNEQKPKPNGHPTDQRGANGRKLTANRPIHQANLDGQELDAKRWLPVGQTPKAGLYTLIEVSDSGIGMSDALQERIFEPFYSTRSGGRGLGLSAVMGILRAHGGALQIHSRLGEGSHFSVLLPPVQQEMGDASPSGAGLQEGGGDVALVSALHHRQRASVAVEIGLLIEPDAKWHDRLLDALQLLNVQMTWASTLEEGALVADLHRAHLGFVLVRSEILETAERLYTLQQHLHCQPLDKITPQSPPALLILETDDNNWLARDASHSLLPPNVYAVEFDETKASIYPFMSEGGRLATSAVFVPSKQWSPVDGSVRELAESIRRALLQKAKDAESRMAN